MFGILFGTLCLVGLIAVVARGRHHRYHHHGYGWHHGHGGRGWGPRGALNAVLGRLDTAPGQEKVILGAVDDFVERARASGRELRSTRKDLAEALRGEQLDDARLEQVFGRHDAAIAELRTAGVDAVRKVHGALDERQRKILSDLVDSGMPFGFWARGHAC
jgi:hypothetical protein